MTTDQLRRFHALEAMTAHPPAHESDAATLWERECLRLADAEVDGLVTAGVVVRAYGLLGMTEDGWAMLTKRMREAGVVRGGVAPLVIPDDF